MFIQKYTRAGFTLKAFMISIAVWFFACLLIYFVVLFAERHRKDKLIQTGIRISKDISSQSGLPLLEKKFKHLGDLINAATDTPGVVFASIIDHKNKIIAFSDQDQFFSLNKENAGQIQGVNYWRVLGPQNNNVMNFSTQITFSGTRVGEVLISLATENLGAFQPLYLTFSVLSLICLLLVFGIANYEDSFAWIRKTVLFPEKPSTRALSQIENESGHICPLCCRPAGFSKTTGQTEAPESMVVLDSYPGIRGRIRLDDLDKYEELSWLKQIIINRCAKIIVAITAKP